MKILLTILLFIGLNANANTYYISNAGSNAANGLTTGTSWQTISKVNSSTFLGGDSILFKCGDTWNEKLIIPSSGSAGNPIILSSYSTGLKPIITGFQSLSLTNQGANIWSAIASNSVKNQNTVTIGGYLQGKARSPNSGYLLTNAVSTTTTINTALTGTPSYVGAEIVYQTRAWITDVLKVTSQSAGALTVYPAATYTTSGNNNYFFQNQTSFLDIQNEWTYDSTTKLLSIYSTASPIVQLSTIDTTIILRNISYVTFNGFNVMGGNIAALILDTCNHITISNCAFNNNGRDAIYARKSDYTTIKQDSIINTLNNPVFSLRYGTNNIIDSNYISKNGMIEGLCMSGNVAGVGIYNDGVSATITNNVLDSTGYSAISFEGTNTLIKNNWIKNFMQVKADGGGIYVVGNTSTAGSIIRKNIVINGGGAGSSGIYADYSSNNITIDSNTVKDCTFAGFLFNSPSNLNVQYNTVVNSKGACFYYSIGGGGGHTFKNNIYYSTDSTQFVYYNYYTAFNSSAVDSNYYLRPVKENLKFRIQELLTSYSLSGFQSVAAIDLHSKESPTGITSAPGILYYNPTLSNSTIQFNGFRVDAKGNKYTNSITLQPFTSVILFNSNLPIVGRLKNLNFQ